MLHSCTMYQSLYRQWFERSREWFELFGEWLKLSRVIRMSRQWFKTAQRGYSNVQRMIQKCPESDSNVQKVIRMSRKWFELSRQWFELSREWLREWFRTVQTVIRIVQRVIQRMIHNCPEIFEFPESDSNCPQNYLNCPERTKKGSVWCSKDWAKAESKGSPKSYLK